VQQALENHHPDKINQPDYTVAIPHKEHMKLHSINPIYSPLTNKMREYDKVVTIISVMKNWTTGFEKDFDYKPEIHLKELEQLKRSLAKELKFLVKDDLKKIHIQGLNVVGLSGILAYAHPSRFKSLRKFLFYCGYKQSSRELKHYCRKIKPIMYILVRDIIMNKDEKYYPLYLKKDAKIRQPEKSKMAIHRIAMNRVATFVLKEVYNIWGGVDKK